MQSRGEICFFPACARDIFNSACGTVRGDAFTFGEFKLDLPVSMSRVQAEFAPANVSAAFLLRRP